MTQEEARDEAAAWLDRLDNEPYWSQGTPRWPTVTVQPNGFVQFTPGSAFVELVMEIPLES